MHQRGANSFEGHVADKTHFPVVREAQDNVALLFPHVIVRLCLVANLDVFGETCFFSFSSTESFISRL